MVNWPHALEARRRVLDYFRLDAKKLGYKRKKLSFEKAADSLPSDTDSGLGGFWHPEVPHSSSSA